MAADEHLGAQWFHGTRHTLKRGLVMEGGHAASNQGYGQPGEHVYYSSRRDVAKDFAEAGYGPRHNLDAPPRLYQVEPIEGHEADPDEESEFQSFRARRARVIRQVAY